LVCQILTINCLEYVQRFATKEAADAATDGNDDDDADEEMSDMGSISENEEVAGHMDL
jgi:ubiquitin-conjugating enzyme E2 H